MGVKSMARPRQPVDLLLYKGKKNLTKNEVENRRKTEIKARCDNVNPPSYLSTKKQKDEFDKIAKELIELGIFSNLDVDTLARFIIAREQYIKLYKRMKSLDCLSDEYSKGLINQDKLFKQCRQCAADLGLNISSRCKLIAPKSEEKQVDPRDQRFGDV